MSTVTTPAAAILAGGRAARMGGGDKALLELGGRTLLARVIDRLAPQADRLAISANGDPARFRAYGLPVLPDSAAGFPGPLAGVLAGMDWAAALGFASVVTVAADTPFFPGDLVQRLTAVPGGFALAASPDADGVSRTQPTFGLWPTALRERLRSALASGDRRVGRWAQEAGAVLVPFPESPDPFFNINTPDDLAQARARLA